MKKVLFLLLLPLFLLGQSEKGSTTKPIFGAYVMPLNIFLANPRINIGGQLIQKNRIIKLELGYGPRWLTYQNLGSEDFYRFHGIRPSWKWYSKKAKSPLDSRPFVGIEFWYDQLRRSKGALPAGIILEDQEYNYLIQKRQRIGGVFQFGSSVVRNGNITIDFYGGIGILLRTISYDTGPLIGPAPDEEGSWFAFLGFTPLPAGQKVVPVINLGFSVGYLFP